MTAPIGPTESTPPAIPLLLAHPFPFDSRVLDALTIRLSELTVLTPDLRGAGEPTIDQLGDQVIGLLDARGAARAVVGGVSMGGYVAMNVLRRYPHRVAGLALINTKSTADQDAARANRFVQADNADRGIRPDPGQLLTGMLSQETFERRPEVVAALTTVIDTQPLNAIAWNQRAMAGRPDSTALLAATEVPVLVVVGADDTITPPDGARAMAGAAPHSTLVEIPGTGHLSVAEDPDAVAAAIIAWWPAVR
jgi:pimeloyl-ACP methyl ester carboxylesterase